MFYKFIAVVFALQLTAAGTGLARAQVYVPGPGYPLCFPIVVAGGGTTIVCQ